MKATIFSGFRFLRIEVSYKIFKKKMLINLPAFRDIQLDYSICTMQTFSIQFPEQFASL